MRVAHKSLWLGYQVKLHLLIQDVPAREPSSLEKISEARFKSVSDKKDRDLISVIPVFLSC
jgi:hypothetical protein